MITVTIAENESIEIEAGLRLQDILESRVDRDHIYAGIHNGKLRDLNFRIEEGGSLRFVYDTSETGKLIYERSLHFLLIVAAQSLFSGARVNLEHALSGGQYIDIFKEPNLTPKDVERIRDEMQRIIHEQHNIHRTIIPTKEAVTYFETLGMNNKADLLRHRESKTSSIYTLCDTHDYFYGIMLPNTSYIKNFSICYFSPGLWLSPQDTFQNQNQLFHVFQEFEAWGNLIGVSNVAQLNQQILQGHMDELVLMSETMVEKKLEELSSSIVHEHGGTKFILIAGPSSAGKSTFSRRLAIHLKILGKKPLTISMDNFYRNRKDCPKLEDGSYDFECLEALDLPLFNETMLKLLNKTPVKLPYFDFLIGERVWQGNEIILDSNDILIIEGIHGLHPKTSENLPNHSKFKIYINALTHLNIDEHNRIPTSDYRLIRRIARDYQFRSWNAQETIHSWKNVREGEDKYIYPYQEEANAIFNSSMVYELSILKRIVIPLLEEVTMDKAEYLEANRLREFLSYFVDGDDSAVPRSSVLAEFIGNSVFDL